MNESPLSRTKRSLIKKLILEALQILANFGIPIDNFTERQKEKSAMALLSVGDIKKSSDWSNIKDIHNDYAPTTREIIAFQNEFLEENISSGSYDDIRRKDLSSMLACELIIRSTSRGGYQINPEYARVIKNYGQKDWVQQVDIFNRSHKSYEEHVSSKRDIPKISVTTPDGKTIELKNRKHNSLKKAVVEEFLTRYGHGAELLYLGDANNKYGLIFEETKLNELGFSDLRDNKLPDVIAYSPKMDWVFLIEAYYSSNPITPTRKLELEKLAGNAASKAIYVTAFENSASYRGCTEELAWETEAWIMTDPDHMIHLNGSRFLGPYNKK